MWLKAQAIQLAQGPIKPTGSIYRAQLGVKRCSGICLLVGTSGKGLGCSLTLEPVETIETTYPGESSGLKRVQSYLTSAETRLRRAAVQALAAADAGAMAAMGFVGWVMLESND